MARFRQRRQAYDLNKAAELQYGKLPELQKQLAEEEEKVKNQDLSLVHESVTEDEIARIISKVDRYSGCQTDRERA